MGKVLHGIKGYASFTGATLLHVTDWELNLSTEPYKTTELSEIPPEYESYGFDGPKMGKGTISVLADDVERAVLPGTVLAASLFAKSGLGYSGSFGVIDFKHGVSRENEQTIQYEVQLTGPLGEINP